MLLWVERVQIHLCIAKNEVIFKEIEKLRNSIAHCLCAGNFDKSLVDFDKVDRPALLILKLADSLGKRLSVLISAALQLKLFLCRKVTNEFFVSKVSECLLLNFR